MFQRARFINDLVHCAHGDGTNGWQQPIDALWCGLDSAAVMAVLIGWNTLKSANQGSRQV